MFAVLSAVASISAGILGILGNRPVEKEDVAEVALRRRALDQGHERGAFPSGGIGRRGKAYMIEGIPLFTRIVTLLAVMVSPACSGVAAGPGRLPMGRAKRL